MKEDKNLSSFTSNCKTWHYEPYEHIKLLVEFITLSVMFS